MQEKQAVTVQVNATISLLQMDSLSKMQSGGCNLLEITDSLTRQAEKIFLLSLSTCIRCYISSARRTAESEGVADKHNTEVREFNHINTMDLPFFFFVCVCVMKRPVTVDDAINASLPF